MTSSPDTARQLVHVASLLASRLCHDLVNPVGALSTGLEVLEGEQDAEMREHAMALIKESAAKTVALLTFSRLAFGASGEWEGTIDASEAGQLSRALYDFSKADLLWDVAPGPMGKAKARTLLNLVLVAERCVPRAGSTVRAEATDAGITVVATGKRAKLSDDLVAALGGEGASLDAKASPAYLAHLLAAASGGATQASMTEGEDENTIRFEARFPD